MRSVLLSRKPGHDRLLVSPPRPIALSGGPAGISVSAPRASSYFALAVSSYLGTTATPVVDSYPGTTATPTRRATISSQAARNLKVAGRFQAASGGDALARPAVRGGTPVSSSVTPAVANGAKRPFASELCSVLKERRDVTRAPVLLSLSTPALPTLAISTPARPTLDSPTFDTTNTKGTH
jgi:hypothetical protein